MVWQNLNKKLSQTELNNFLKKAIRQQLPTKGRGSRYPRILKLEQVDTVPPWFKIIIPANTFIAPSYLNFLANNLRKQFKLIGAPVKVSVGSV